MNPILVFVFAAFTAFTTSARADMMPMPSISDFAVPDQGLSPARLYGALPGKETKLGEDPQNTYFERRVRNDVGTSLLVCKRLTNARSPPVKAACSSRWITSRTPSNSGRFKSVIAPKPRRGFYRPTHACYDFFSSTWARKGVVR
jgi:hypothetical protein